VRDRDLIFITRWRRPKYQFGGSYVYFLYASDELLHIGKTRQLRARLKAHRYQRRIPFTRYRLISVEPRELSKTEARLIKQHNPPYNWKHTDREYEIPEPSTPVDLAELEGVV
jgi:hypothetical protein